MALIFCYVGFMAAGDIAAYLLGSAVEYEWGSHVSLVVFLAYILFSFGWHGYSAFGRRSHCGLNEAASSNRPMGA